MTRLLALPLTASLPVHRDADGAIVAAQGTIVVRIIGVVSAAVVDAVGADAIEDVALGASSSRLKPKTVALSLTLFSSPPRDAATTKSSHVNRGPTEPIGHLGHWRQFAHLGREAPRLFGGQLAIVGQHRVPVGGNLFNV